MEEKKNEVDSKTAGGTDTLNHVTEEEIIARRLNRAFAVIREHIDRGHRFSFDQMDTGIEISLSNSSILSLRHFMFSRVSLYCLIK